MHQPSMKETMGFTSYDLASLARSGPRDARLDRSEERATSSRKTRGLELDAARR